MFPVSSAFKAALASGAKPRERIIVETFDETLTLTESDIVQSTLTINEATSSNTAFQLGGVVIGNMSVSIHNKGGQYDDVQFNGAELRPYIGLEISPGQIEWVPMGVFTVDKPNRMIDAITLTGVDNMAWMETSFSSVSVTFPCSALVLLSAVCQYCGVPLATTSFLHSAYMIADRPSGNLSCRDVLACIAELAGCFARCNRYGQLELGWYDNPAPVQEAQLDGNVDNADGGDFSHRPSKTYDGGVFKPDIPVLPAGDIGRLKFTQDDTPIIITGVSLETDDRVILAGSDRYALTITDNPLIQANAEQVIQDVWDKLHGFTFLPMTLEWQGNPAVQAADLVEIADRKGNRWRTVLTQSKYKYRDICIATSIGAPERQAAYRSRAEKQISRIRANMAQKQVQLDALDLAIKNAFQMIAGIWGGHVINGDTLGGVHQGNMYIADAADPTEAVKVWRWNLGGLGYSENGINGPFAVAITADGSIVASLITASMIQTGLLQSLNGKSWIDMDNGAFSLGDGALQWSAANGFKAISAERLTDINAKVYARIGAILSGVQTGLTVWHADVTDRPMLSLGVASPEETSNPGADIQSNGQLAIEAWLPSGGRREIWMDGDNMTLRAVDNAGHYCEIAITPLDISFLKNGNPYGLTYDIPPNKTLQVKNGIITGYY